MTTEFRPGLGPTVEHAQKPDRTDADRVEPRVWRSRRPGRISTLAGIGTTVVTVLPVFLVGGLSVQLADSTELTQSRLGIVVAMYWAASALSSPVAGRLTARSGPRSGMALAAIIGGVSLLGIAAYTPTWEWLLVWLAVAGAANALGHPPSNDLIGRGVSTRNRAFAYGIKQGAVPLATFCAGLAVPLLGLTVGWQWTFAIAGFLASLVVAFVVWKVPSALVKARRVRAGRRAGRMPRPLVRFLSLASLASGLGAAQTSAMGAFTVSAAIDAGFTAAIAGLLLSLGSLANVVSRPLVGWIADRGIGGTMTTVSVMMASGSVGLLGMALALPWSFAIGCVIAFGLGWGWSGLLHYVVSHAAQDDAARATGLVQTGAYIGSAAGPLVMGFVFDSFGSTTGWITAAVIAALAATAALIAAAFHPDRHPRRSGSTTHRIRSSKGQR